MGVGLGFASFFIVVSVGINFHFYKSLLTSDAMKFLSISVGSLFVVLCFLVAINYLIHKNNKIFDLTPNKVNSLSQYTMNTVNNIREDFTFTYLYTDTIQNKKNELKIKNAIRRYQDLNPKISFTSFSVIEHPEKAHEFKIGMDENALFATFAERTHRVTAIDEVSLTNAIIKLTQKPKKIYFIQAKGEKRLEDPGSYGLSRFKKEMERLHYVLEPLNEFKIPHDAAFVAIVGPRLSYEESELRVLREYVRQGGRLFLAIDPGESHNLANLTKSFGVEFQNAFVFEKSNKDSKASELATFVKPATGHPLTSSLGQTNRPLLFMASPLKIAISGEKQRKVTPMLKFSSASVARAEMGIESPIVHQGSQLASTLIEQVVEGVTHIQMFVIGDSDFLSNQFFSQYANFDFTMNLMSYLSMDDDMINFQPRKAQTNYLTIPTTTLNLYFLFFVIPFSLFFFIIAIFLKLRRLF